MVPQILYGHQRAAKLTDALGPDPIFKLAKLTLASWPLFKATLLLHFTYNSFAGWPAKFQPLLILRDFLVLVNRTFQLCTEKFILTCGIVLALIAVKHNWVKRTLSELSSSLVSCYSDVHLESLKGKVFIQPIFSSNDASLRLTNNSLNQLLRRHTGIAIRLYLILMFRHYVHHVEG